MKNGHGAPSNFAGIVHQKWTTNRAVIHLDDGRRLSLAIPEELRGDVDVGTAVDLVIAEGGRVESWDISRSPSRDDVPDPPPRSAPQEGGGTAPTVGEQDKTPAGWLFGDGFRS